jgi:hypothetical protein
MADERRRLWDGEGVRAVPPRPRRSHLVRNLAIGCVGLAALFGLLAGALLVIGLLAGPSRSETPAAFPDTNNPPEYDLARLQTGGAPDGNLVRQFGRELDIAAQECSGTRREIAEATFTANRALVQGGIRESLLQTLTTVNRFMLTLSGTATCARAFTLYSPMRINTP